MMSLKDNHQKTFENFLKEEEPYQNSIKIKHSSGKKKLIGSGNQKNTDPYTRKADLTRSKSAPPTG